MNERAVQLNEPKPVPQGWRWVRLDEVCDEADTHDPGLSPDSTFRYIDISSIDATRKRIIDSHTILGKEAPSRARQVVKTNDVLVATTRPNLNAVALIPAELDDQICSTGFCVLRPTTVLDPVFLFFWVQARDFVKILSGEVRGLLYPAVTDNQVRSMSIPLPPLPEQKRIAARVRDLLDEAVCARTACEAQLEAVEALPSAYLHQVFESEEAKRWERRRLGEVAKIVNGFGFPNYLQGKRQLEFPFVKVADMNLPGNEVYITCAANTVDEAILHELGARAYPPGTVIFPKVGGAIATNKKRILSLDATFDNNIMGVVPSESILSDWIYCLLESIDLSSMSRVTAVPSIRQSDIASLIIPLPPLPEQKRITAGVENKLEHMEKLKVATEKQLETIKALPQAILRKAFFGEL